VHKPAEQAAEGHDDDEHRTKADAKPARVTPLWSSGWVVHRLSL
jgi:hypothetical protein